MAQTTPSRRALVDLPVNTFGTPPSITAMRKASMGQKRQIQEVEEPEFAQPTSRVRVSPARSQSTLKDDAPSGQTQPALSEAMSVYRVSPARSQSTLKDDGLSGQTQPALSGAMSVYGVSPARSQSTLKDDGLSGQTQPVLSGAMSVYPSATHMQAESIAEEPAEEMGEGDSQNSYKDSAMSSVVDFDPDDTMVSQQTAATEVTQPLRSRISQHAETLRLRLRLAHFKVQTNQTNLPLSQLQISPKQGPPPQNFTSTRDEQPSLPKLLPAPILLPTAFSSRMISRQQDLSSPPCSPDQSVQKDRSEVFRTPALPRHKAPTAQRQLSSPPGSGERISKRRYDDEDKLTSSAIRGNAAIGLLGLRKER